MGGDSRYGRAIKDFNGVTTNTLFVVRAFHGFFLVVAQSLQVLYLGKNEGSRIRSHVFQPSSGPKGGGLDGQQDREQQGPHMKSQLYRSVRERFLFEHESARGHPMEKDRNGSGFESPGLYRQRVQEIEEVFRWLWSGCGRRSGKEARAGVLNCLNNGS